MRKTRALMLHALHTGMVLVAALGFAVAAHAQSWGTLANISDTMGVNAGRVCLGEASRQDIGCPTYAPSVNSAGLLTATSIATGGLTVTGATSLAGVSATNVSVTTNLTVGGVLTAGSFIGDGSGLTGVTAAATDRITSGTTSLVAVSNTGYISLTQAGSNTGWFDPTRGLVTLGVSATGGISGTTGYFSGRVGIGTANPSGFFQVITPATTALGFVLSDATTYTLKAGYAASSVGYMGGDTGTEFALYANNSERMRLTNSGSVGIGTSAPAISLTVVGEVQVSNSGVTCSSSTAGAIRYTGGTLSYCNGSSFTSLAASGATGQEDRITSGTTSLVANNNGSISFTTAGSNQMIMDASGNVAIGNNIPYSKLDVFGTTTVRGNLAVASTTAHIYLTTQGGAYSTMAIDNGQAYMAMTANGNIGELRTVSNSAIALMTSNTIRQFITGNGQIGIGSITPAVSLTVVGEVQVSNSGVTCSSSTAGAIRYTGGTLSYCNGSSFTSLAASGATGQEDRITSGTTSLVAISTTSFISLTQGGSNTAWFDPTRGLVTLGVNSTGGISGTTGYFTGNVGIGGVIPSVKVNVLTSGLGTDGIVVQNSGGNSLSFLPALSSGALNGLVQAGDTGIVYSRGVDAGTFVLAPWANSVSGLRMIASGYVALGGLITPTTPLDVSGTVKATRFEGDGSGLTGVTAAATDRISTSGVSSGASLGMAVASAGTISFTLAGTEGAAYLHPTLGLVAPGVSATGPLSGTTVYAADRLMVSTTAAYGLLNVATDSANTFAVETDSLGTILGPNGGSLLSGYYTSNRIAGIKFNAASANTGSIYLGTMTSGVFYTNMLMSSAGTAISGTDSVVLRLNISGTSTATSGGGYGLYLSNYNPTSEARSAITFQAADAGGTLRHGAVILSGKENGWTAGGGDYPGYLAFHTRQSAGNNTEKVRITSSGSMGIGTSSPNSNLDVSGTIQTSGTVAGFLFRDRSTGTNGYQWYSENGKAMLYNAATTSNVLEITSNGNFGIGTAAPATSLTVVGEVQVSNSGVVCNGATAGAIRYTGGTLSYCNGSSFTELSAGGGGSSSDRITSGTAPYAAVIANSTSGVISFTLAGSAAAYIHPTLGLVVPGVSITTGVGISTTAMSLSQGGAGQANGRILMGTNRFLHRFYPTGSTGYNTFLGLGSGNTSMAISGNAEHASYNTAVGEDALRSLTTGYKNTMMGAMAGYALTSGYDNTGIGIQALYNATSAQGNTGVGKGALYSNNSGNHNTSVGVDALALNTTGSENVGLGGFALTQNVNGSQNTAVGTYAMYNNTSGTQNVALGKGALYNNISGSYNIAIGVGTLNENKQGDYNTALGNTALYSNYLGSGNSAFGIATLFQNTGSNNIAMGNQALYYKGAGDDNVAIGYGAGRGSGTPQQDRNTLVGSNSGYSLTTAEDNTMIGYYAGNTTTTGDRNIIIGHSKTAPAAATSDYLNIGGVITANMASGGSMTLTLNTSFSNHVSVTGNVSAAKFIGDGSLLTGISAGSAATDRISTSGVSSGASLGMAVASAGTISFTTGGTAGTAYIDTVGRFVGPGISATSNRSSFTTIFASGKVGVGASTMASQFTVSASWLSAMTGTSNGGLRLDGTYEADKYNALDFGWPGQNPAARIAMMANGSGSNLVFGTSSNYASGITNSAMWINPSGNVGIGTTAPSTTLHVVGRAQFGNANSMIQWPNVSGTFTDSSAGTRMIMHSDNHFYLDNYSGDLAFRRAAYAETMRLTSAGLVGIGTAAPSYLLDTQQTSTATSGGRFYTARLYRHFNPASASSAFMGNALIQCIVGGGANNITGDILCSNPISEYTGTGTLTNMYSNYAGAYNSAAGTITNAVANVGVVQNAAGGNMGTGVAFQSVLYNTGAGTLSTGIGYQTNWAVTNGAMTQGIGLYLNDSPATTGYGIYQLGTNDANYFEGDLRIGSNASVGKVTIYPSAPEPSNGIDTFGLVTSGSYGGGIGLRDSTGNFGIWLDTTGTVARFGFGSSLGALTQMFSLTSSAATVTGDLNYTGTLTDTSDRRLKTNIQPLTNDMATKLGLLKPVSFEMRDKPGVKEIGFVAQDVEAVFPELVKTAADTSGTKSLNYVGLIAPLVQAVQELKATQQLQQRENELLRGRIEQLERQLQGQP